MKVYLMPPYHAPPAITLPHLAGAYALLPSAFSDHHHTPLSITLLLLTGHLCPPTTR